jgi:hypothetical protein
MRTASIAFILALMLTAFGCNTGPRVVTIKGVATRKGEPIRDATLNFYPEDGSRPSWGVTDDQGRFELEYDRDTKGAIVTTHKVTATFVRPPQAELDIAAGKLKTHPDERLIVEKFGNKETTTLRIEITKAEKDLQIKLD